eukprot:7184750-Lingulodinium_polyedra.AAC.1
MHEGARKPRAALHRCQLDPPAREDGVQPAQDPAIDALAAEAGDVGRHAGQAEVPRQPGPHAHAVEAVGHVGEPD